MTETIAESPEWQRWEDWGIRRGLTAGRAVLPQRSAKRVVLLASGQAVALSGRYIGVDDDMAEMLRRAEEIQQDELYTLWLRTWVPESWKQELVSVSVPLCSPPSECELENAQKASRSWGAL